MVVHPGYGNFTGTLLNGLLYYFQDKRSKNGDPIVPYLVHRIDKDNSWASSCCQERGCAGNKQFFDHTIERKYYALVWAASTRTRVPL